jgi:hypothetical protein
MKSNNSKAHVTIENVEKLAAKIVAAYNVTIKEARGLAEFNLNFSDSYAAAAARV